MDFLEVRAAPALTSFHKKVIEMDLPKRKPNRLKGYHYDQPNAYFITICTDQRKNLFWSNAGARIASPQNVVLSAYGKTVDSAIENIAKHYPAITVDNYVVMPNHIHLLLQIHSGDNGRAMPAPTISTVIQQMKGYVTKQTGIPIWQKLFHDHIIRNEKEYREIWEYIENNPVKWEEDCFYTE